jgi:hypothetical protein
MKVSVRKRITKREKRCRGVRGRESRCKGVRKREEELK